MLELYSAYLAGRKTNNKIGDSTIDCKQEFLGNIRTTYRDFDVSELKKLTADELGGWITVHRAQDERGDHGSTRDHPPGRQKAHHERRHGHGCPPRIGETDTSGKVAAPHNSGRL